MSQAYKCESCDQFFEGEPRYRGGFFKETSVTLHDHTFQVSLVVRVTGEDTNLTEDICPVCRLGLAQHAVSALQSGKDASHDKESVSR